MTNISLLDDCIMLKYDNEVQTYCQEFSCGEADLDDFSEMMLLNMLMN